MGNVLDFVPNLLNVPTFMLYSGADELVHSQTSIGMDRAFKAAGGLYTWYYHPAAEHLTYFALDDWRKEAADTANLSLVTNPARVTYVRDPGHRQPGVRHPARPRLLALADHKPWCVQRTVDSPTTGAG